MGALAPRLGAVAALQSRGYAFKAPGSYVFGKVAKPVRPKNRITPLPVRKRVPRDKTLGIAKMEPYNRETKGYEYRRLAKLDPEERIRDALNAAKEKKLVENNRLEILAATPEPRQQIGRLMNFTHPPRKMNNYARLIRKMPANTALEQLTFMQHIKAARGVMLCLEETVKNARVNQGIPSENLWVAYSYVGRGAADKKEMDIKGRGRFGLIKHRKTHYFLVLEEGKPPKKQSKYIPHNVLTRWVHDRPAPFIQTAC